MRHKKNKQQYGKDIYVEFDNIKESIEARDDESSSNKIESDISIIKKYLTELTVIMEKSRMREYMTLTTKPRRLFLINFVAGIGKGFGQAIGFSVLTALLFYVLTLWIDLPIIGNYIAKILDIVDIYREG